MKFNPAALAAALLLSLAPSGGAQICANPLVEAIVKEHNRIRADPAGYAAGLQTNKSALIRSRTEGVRNPDDVATATRAVETAIADLKAAHPLPPLTCSEDGSRVARHSAQTLHGSHSDLARLQAAWVAARAVGVPRAESIATIRASGSDQEQAEALLQDLVCDWGEANKGKYLHRMFVLDYQTARLLDKSSRASRQQMQFTRLAIGIDGDRIYLQYAM